MAGYSPRVQKLLKEMTLDEKIGQLCQSSGAEFSSPEAFYHAVREGKIGSRILACTQWAGTEGEPMGAVSELNHMQKIAVEESRLKIPVLIGRDVIHGHRTVFPVALGLACAWDEELWEETARVAAKEARADGIHWTFSPMVDIGRDPRWGRMVEGPGEDPYLGGKMAAAMIKGFQNSESESLLSCLKHFVGYGFAEGGRDYDTCEISEYSLRNNHMIPFHEGVKAGAAAVMTAFHDINGVPCTANKHLFDEVLRKEWGFNGFVVSDWAAIKELELFGVAENKEEAAMLAMNAGVDMEMVLDCYPRYLKKLVEEKNVSMKRLDQAVASILSMKEKAGLFERPYTDETLSAKTQRRPEHLNLAKESAVKSIILLKNSGILPLDIPEMGKGKRIAIVGPFAHEKRSLLGNWTLDGKAEETMSVVEALREALPEARIVDTASPLLDEQINIARTLADVIICCVGESWLSSGEHHNISRLRLPPGQDELIEALGQWGKPLIVVSFCGRPLPMPAAERYAQAILWAWHPGSEGARAVTDLLLGKAAPSGKLTVSIPKETGHIPIYYNRKPMGKALDCGDRYKPYEDSGFAPLYPFGFGLTYTAFKISNQVLGKDFITRNETTSISYTVKNTGSCEGTTTIQLYVRDSKSKRVRPVRELRGFKTVTLVPGETKKMSFEITKTELGYWTEAEGFHVESGEFLLGVGEDSRCELNMKLMVK
jgi:beta-glucosidase